MVDEFREHAELVEQLRASLPPNRFRHSLSVAGAALWLSRIHNIDRAKALYAALCHDYARHYEPQRLLNLANEFAILVDEVDVKYPVLLHGPVGAKLVQVRFHCYDPQIGRAIALHTTGGAGMDSLAQLVYLADCIAPGRRFPGVERLRLLAMADLAFATWQALRANVRWLVESNRLLHPNTVAAYHEFQTMFQK
ncbi:MAG: bis(5'-nucleosyl)-tetraphosphatase (symmetrical) YqeK [Bacillota bacterium]|jgi:predicted HD superfamily hydrolase involved in NAD metabolism